MKIKRKLLSLICAASFGAAACLPASASAVQVSDPNGDGQITISDASYILSYLYCQYEPTNLDALDFDRNGVISEMDYQSVKMYLAQLWNGKD